MWPPFHVHVRGGGASSDASPDHAWSISIRAPVCAPVSLYLAASTNTSCQSVSYAAADGHLLLIRTTLPSSSEALEATTIAPLEMPNAGPVNSYRPHGAIGISISLEHDGAPPGSSPPRDPSPIYLPWPGRSAICGGRRTFSPGGFSACAPQQPQSRARTAHPRHHELLQGDKISDWRPPYGQQDLNLSSARLV